MEATFNDLYKYNFFVRNPLTFITPQGYLKDTTPSAPEVVANRMEDLTDTAFSFPKGKYSLFDWTCGCTYHGLPKTVGAIVALVTNILFTAICFIIGIVCLLAKKPNRLLVDLTFCSFQHIFTSINQIFRNGLRSVPFLGHFLGNIYSSITDYPIEKSPFLQKKFNQKAMLHYNSINRLSAYLRALGLSNDKPIECDQLIYNNGNIVLVKMSV